MADSLGLLRRSGVACLLGIDGRPQSVVDRRAGARRSTRSSRTASSSAASTRTARTGSPAVDSLDRARARWPEELEAFVGLRVPLDRFAEAFAYRGVKATLVLDD